MRSWRRLRTGRNPLARVSDRLEAALLITVCSGLALAIPLGAVVGQWSFSRQVVASARTSLSGHYTTATVLHDTPQPVVLSEGVGAVISTTSAPVRWTAADGTEHTGQAGVPSGSRAGTPVALWISATGDPAAPPTSTADAATKGAIAGLFTWLGTSGLLLLAGVVARLILDRRRLAGWDRAWAAYCRRPPA